MLFFDSTGVGDFSSVKRLKKEARTIFQEYIISQEKEDALEALHELGTPAFNFQVVTQGLRVAIEKKDPKSADMVLDLIQFFQKMGTISRSETSKGFQNCQMYLKDLTLDVPSAEKDFREIEEKAEKRGLF